MEIKGKTIGTGKPLLCVPVMESNTEEIIDELRTLAKSEADIVEWRIDTFVDYKNYNAVREVFAAAAECMKEKIFLYTFRTKKQGGMGELAPDELNDLHDLRQSQDAWICLIWNFLRRSIRQEKSESFISRA